LGRRQRLRLSNHFDEPLLYIDYTKWWLRPTIDGLIGDGLISPNTAADYEWRLGYSRRFFGETPVDQIDRNRSLSFKAQLLLEAGADLRDPWGQAAGAAERTYRVTRWPGLFARLRPIGPIERR
jgi:hypothetical protein